MSTTANELAALEYVDEAAGASGHRRFGAPPTAGAFDDAAFSFMLCAKFFAVSDEMEGRAVVYGVDRIREPERAPKTTEPPAPPPVVTDEDPEMAELKRRAAAAAARRAAEQRDLARRITGTPKGELGSDGEPRSSTQQPGRSRFSSGIWDAAP